MRWYTNSVHILEAYYYTVNDAKNEKIQEVTGALHSHSRAPTKSLFFQMWEHTKESY